MPKGCSPKPKGINSSAYVHGASIRNAMGRQDKFYATWVRIRQRCRNEKNPDFKYYGARGIKICNRWDNFENFRKDMKPSYDKHLKEIGEPTIDRIDVNGHYTKGNCKWSTRLEQSNNRNYNKSVEYDGRRQTIRAWIVELRLPFTWKQIYKRIFTRGWNVRRAFYQPYGTKLKPSLGETW